MKTLKPRREIMNATVVIDGRRVVHLNRVNCEHAANIIPDIIANIRGHIADTRKDPAKDQVEFSIVVRFR